jgi:hypothetical protein
VQPVMGTRMAEHQACSGESAILTGNMVCCYIKHIPVHAVYDKMVTEEVTRVENWEPPDFMLSSILCRAMNVYG